MESGRFIIDIMVYETENIPWRTYSALCDWVWDRPILDRRSSDRFFDDRTYRNSCFTASGASFDGWRSCGYHLAEISKKKNEKVLNMKRSRNKKEI